MPSMTMCGLKASRSRSLQVPGSPSSELQTRYFAPGKARGMKLHFRPGREARAAAAAQGAGLQFGDDLVGRHRVTSTLAENLLQRRVAAALLVVGKAPVRSVEAGINLRVDVAAVKAGLSAGGLESRKIDSSSHFAFAFKVSTRSSSRFSSMKLNISRSLTSITGASAQAPRHSLGCIVNTPSAVVP